MEIIAKVMREKGYISKLNEKESIDE
jgi:hypothetical protein